MVLSLLSVGIYDPAQLRGLRLDTEYGRNRRFALDLMAEIERFGNAGIGQAYIENIADGAGVYKRTYSGRFPSFDKQILACIAKRHLSQRLRVLDVAVSDGSTSVEFFEGIAGQITADFEFTATDRDPSYLVLNRKGSPNRRAILSANGELVQMVWPPFVVSSTKRESLRLFPLNAMVRPYALRYGRRLAKQWKNNDPTIEVRELMFACRLFRDLLAKDRRPRFTAWDITTPWNGHKMHCIRAMNILNPSYFSTPQLDLIVKTLVASLAEGGLLAIGSNEGPQSEVDGAIYRMEEGRLTEIACSGAGGRCRVSIQPLLAVSAAA